MPGITFNWGKATPPTLPDTVSVAKHQAASGKQAAQTAHGVELSAHRRSAQSDSAANAVKASLPSPAADITQASVNHSDTSALRKIASACRSSYELKMKSGCSDAGSNSKGTPISSSASPQANAAPSSYIADIKLSETTKHGSPNATRAGMAAVAKTDIRDSMKNLLKGLPNQVHNPSMRKMENVAKRLGAYLEHTRNFRGEVVGSLLATEGLKMSDLVGSIRTYSSLDKSTARKMAFERQLYNVEMSSAPEEKNMAALGCKTSYATRKKDSRAIEPGMQLSMAMDTLIRREDGQVKKVTILSCSAPALDIDTQPEWQHYIGDSGRLDRANYQTAIDALADHMRQCARDKQGSAKRMAFAGIGLSNFLKGLTNWEDREKAQSIVIKALAGVITQTRALGIEAGFTDINDDLCKLINEELDDDAQIAVLGRIPGNWIEDNDIILNAWDPHSLVGNKMQGDPSLDGWIGRSSLVHVQHAIACVLNAEGVELKKV